MSTYFKTSDELLALVYDELRKLAAAKLAREAPGHTLQPTALVHEAWLRLAGTGKEGQFENCAHFFSAAAEAMRRILIDRARRRRTTLHGGGKERVDIADAEIAAPAADDELLAVHEALEKYEKINPAKAELVKLRYFAGMTHDEAAKQLGISVVTAKRHWETARAWLYLEIKLDRAGPPPGSMLQKP